MVEIPPLPFAQPVSTDPEPVVVEDSVVEFEPRESNLNKALTYLDRLKPDDIAEIYVWLAEHPMPGIDPVRLALASYDSLLEPEILDYFNEMRNRMQPDLWKVLTE